VLGYFWLEMAEASLNCSKQINKKEFIGKCSGKLQGGWLAPGGQVTGRNVLHLCFPVLGFVIRQLSRSGARDVGSLYLISLVILWKNCCSSQ
jgi:hypothetical protein